MAKRIVTIRIEVDLDSEASKQWESKVDYFENEIDEVLDKLSSISKREYSKYSSEKGLTENNSPFALVVKKVK